MSKLDSKYLVVCVANDGYPAALERRKIYEALADGAANKQGLVRIIDESGEDYLYPKSFFQVITLSPSARKAILSAA